MLIGEFLRQHHPRLAHEIALHGFPGHQTIAFAPELELRIRNMIGLIARSHGVSLRACTDYIEAVYGKNGRRHPNHTHATFLMVLLRLADYIQIDHSRTSPARIKAKAFSSPVSEMEHFAHLAIDQVDHTFQDDPERILVTASPNDSQMFLKINKLIGDIQQEFDLSWAVLGELYGNLDFRPGIKFRRIISNLTDESFVSRQSYIADYFSFGANDEIIRLLVAPLYGDDPKYGVRELLQNALDACNERAKVEHDKGNAGYTPAVYVDVIDEGDPVFIISDNGVGMDVDVIRDYFLRAGASYRKSMDWQKQYTDEEKKSLVQRSGRFGIGILAAFLIGGGFEIETRRGGSPTGYRFRADLNMSQINVMKDTAIGEGTRIVIRISMEMLGRLDPSKYPANWYKWYTLSYPAVHYSYLGKALIPYKKLYPGVQEPYPPAWSDLEDSGYKRVVWRYSEKSEQPRITCNGIIIPFVESSNFLGHSLIRNKPIINIFDFDATLPLTLNRDRFSEPLPLMDQMLVEMYKGYIACLLMFRKVCEVSGRQISLDGSELHFAGAHVHNRRGYYDMSYRTNLYSNYNGVDLLNRVFVGKKGFVVDYHYFIRKLNGFTLLFLQSETIQDKFPQIELDLQDHFFHFTRCPINSIADYVRAIEPSSFRFDRRNNFNIRVLIKNEKYHHLLDPSTRRDKVIIRGKCQFKYSLHGWTCAEFDQAPSSTVISPEFLERYGEHLNFIREQEIKVPENGGDAVLNELLEKYIGDDVIIPIAIEERRKKYPLAFKELERYMKRYAD